MLTKEQINAEIQELLQKAKADPQMPLSEKVKLQNQLAFRRHAISYIDTSPRQEFIEKVLQSLKDKKKKIEEDFNTFYSPSAPDITAMRQQFYAKMGYSTVSSQVNLLSYILSK